MRAENKVVSIVRQILRPKSVVLAMIAVAPSIAPAAVLYKTGFGNVEYDNNPAASATNVIATYVATSGTRATFGPPSGVGRGDDYKTNFTTLTVTSLRFVGALQGSADGLAIEFYKADGTRVSNATRFASNSLAELKNSTMHTISFASQPVDIDGSGYVIFAPYTFNFDGNVNPAISLGFSNGNNAALFDVGTNNATASAEVNYNASEDKVLSPVNVEFTSNRLTLELNGTGTGAIPEPTAVALFSPVVLLLKRRRRQN